MDETLDNLADLDASPETARRIFDEYFDRLVRYSRKRIAGMPSRAIDEEDVAQSAMKSFFVGVEAGRFELKSRDELWKVLATITVRKAIAQLRRHYAEKRGGGGVRGESVFLNPNDPEMRTGIDQILGEGNLGAMSDDLTVNCREMLARLPDSISRDTALLKLQGYSNAEIAEKHACSLATVKRRLARIREEWSEADASSPG